MQGALSRLPSWELDRDEEDIRGWALRDGAGHVLGTVGELIVDTRTESVVQVVLGDGKKFSAHDVLIGDHFLTLSGGHVASTPVPKAGSIQNDAHVEMPRRAAPAAPVATARARLDESPVAIDDSDLILPLIDEEIDVTKRRFDAGGVRIDAHVVTQPFDQDVALHEEHVRVERRAVDQPLNAADVEARLHDAMIEVAARSELPVIDKSVHVIEEIILKKDAAERSVQVRETVRRTSVEVTKLPGVDLAIKGAKEP